MIYEILNQNTLKIVGEVDDTGKNTLPEDLAEDFKRDLDKGTKQVLTGGMTKEGTYVTGLKTISVKNNFREYIEDFFQKNAYRIDKEKGGILGRETFTKSILNRLLRAY